MTNTPLRGRLFLMCLLSLATRAKVTYRICIEHLKLMLERSRIKFAVLQETVQGRIEHKRKGMCGRGRKPGTYRLLEGLKSGLRPGVKACLVDLR